MMTLHLSEVHHIMEETQMNRDTYEKIVALRLPGMAKTYLEQEEMEDIRGKARRHQAGRRQGIQLKYAKKRRFVKKRLFFCAGSRSGHRSDCFPKGPAAQLSASRSNRWIKASLPAQYPSMSYGNRSASARLSCAYCSRTAACVRR